MTDRPCLVWLKKKISMTHQQSTLRVCCYRLLCTSVGDGILCALSPDHKTHGEKWCLSLMDDVCFEVKKCVGNASPKRSEDSNY